MRSLRLALLAAQLVTGQSAPHVIGVDVELVNIQCSVREKTGAWAQSLDKKDFEVREDGRVQPITHSAGEADSPLTIAVLLDVPPPRARHATESFTKSK